VDSGCGCSMAIRMRVIDELGWFDPTYFLYNEDNELCYRYSKAGYKIKLASKSIVHHYFWGSTDVISSAKIFYGVRNRLWFIKKYFGRKRFLYFWLRALGRTLDYAQKFDKIHFTNYLKALIHATR
ncbi:glycosyltransferase family 2 protein, partial [Candidatus Dojkabacteria bacterium]|nr:glycosyltransferase family 2 protein [Candidatus Dojkabacteria bacterium]